MLRTFNPESRVRAPGGVHRTHSAFTMPLRCNRFAHQSSKLTERVRVPSTALSGGRGREARQRSAKPSTRVQVPPAAPYGCSSTGRAAVSKTAGWGFEPLRPCQRDVAQLGRAPALGAGRCTFKSCHPDQQTIPAPVAQWESSCLTSRLSGVRISPGVRTKPNAR